MKELRKPNEIILRDGRTLKEVLELHNMWLNNEEGGERLDLSEEDLTYSDLKDVNLSKANLRYTYLNNANLSGVDLSYANLYNTNLYKANLEGANLRYTYLYKANLEGANLYKANLIDANLYKANLIDANLSKSDLYDAILTNTKFYLTNLYKAKGDFVGVENIGSRNDTTHYFYEIDKVICGCFDGTMKQFEEKVKKSYDEDEVEYKEYMIAIDTLKRLAELY